jgi:hypothetical protein
MSLMQLANDAGASTASQSGKLLGVMSLMQLANDAGASVLTRSDNAATHLADALSERESTAAQSGKLLGVIGGITWH